MKRSVHTYATCMITHEYTSSQHVYIRSVVAASLFTPSTFQATLRATLRIYSCRVKTRRVNLADWSNMAHLVYMVHSQCQHWMLLCFVFASPLQVPAHKNHKHSHAQCLCRIYENFQKMRSKKALIHHKFTASGCHNIIFTVTSQYKYQQKVHYGSIVDQWSRRIIYGSAVLETDRNEESGDTELSAQHP